MNTLELITITSTLALMVAEDLTDDELELLILLLVQISNTFNLVLNQRSNGSLVPITPLG